MKSGKRYLIFILIVHLFNSFFASRLAPRASRLTPSAQNIFLVENQYGGRNETNNIQNKDQAAFPNGPDIFNRSRNGRSAGVNLTIKESLPCEHMGSEQVRLHSPVI